MWSMKQWSIRNMNWKSLLPITVYMALQKGNRLETMNGFCGEHWQNISKVLYEYVSECVCAFACALHIDNMKGGIAMLPPHIFHFICFSYFHTLFFIIIYFSVLHLCRRPPASFALLLRRIATENLWYIRYGITTKLEKKEIERNKNHYAVNYRITGIGINFNIILFRQFFQLDIYIQIAVRSYYLIAFSNYYRIY